MLCDSVGIAPAPNNGTLRLPLKPIGLHSDPDSGLETPADPVEASTIPTTSGAVKPTKSILVDPVPTSTGTATPIQTIGVDKPAPQASGADGKSDVDHDDKSNIDKIESSVKDFWDWYVGPKLPPFYGCLGKLPYLSPPHPR